MPELPEVETVLQEVKPQVLKKKFWKVKVLDQISVQPSAVFLEENLPGKTVQNITRKGKFIIFELSGGLMMVVHLRMTGMLLFEPSQRLKKFIRVEFTFTNGRRMYFSDIRRFGRIWLFDKKKYLQATGLVKLGVDPITERFDLELIKKLFAGKKGILKNTLLNQSLIAGIGNIYADEICFRSYLHPSARLESLSERHLEALHEAVVFCLQEGIKHNGTTISDFVGARGNEGKHQKYLQIYGRAGDKCYRCDTEIQKIRVAGRGTYFCRKCQKI
jgi:formamidopyrimidine-DNA glycosylase